MPHSKKKIKTTDNYYKSIEYAFLDISKEYNIVIGSKLNIYHFSKRLYHKKIKYFFSRFIDLTLH